MSSPHSWRIFSCSFTDKVLGIPGNGSSTKQLPVDSLLATPGVKGICVLLGSTCGELTYPEHRPAPSMVELVKVEVEANVGVAKWKRSSPIVQCMNEVIANNNISIIVQPLVVHYTVHGGCQWTATSLEIVL
jgi:hypothetical protein